MAAGRVRELSLLISIFLHLIFHSNNQVLSSGFYFEKIRGSDDDVIESSTAFHQCSFDGNCIYVGKISKDANLKRISDTSNLGSFHALWKKVEEPGFSDCKQALQHGVSSSGLVKLRLSASLVKIAYCDMVTKGGGWTVIQRRVDNTVNFNRNWKSYKEGFGDPFGNFWLGLEALHQLTATGSTVLRIEMKKDDGSTGYAEYTDFKILNEAQEYKLEYNSYSGIVGDAMLRSKNMKFSTYDNDNDAAAWNCAYSWRGGWWHYQCFDANFNNDYYNSSETEAFLAHTMSWRSSWTDLKYGKITFAEMKLRKVN